MRIYADGMDEGMMAYIIALTTSLALLENDATSSSNFDAIR
jgi:hypothetical protein